MFRSRLFTLFPGCITGFYSYRRRGSHSLSACVSLAIVAIPAEAAARDPSRAGGRAEGGRALRRTRERPPARLLAAAAATPKERALRCISPPGTPSSSARVARRSLSWYREDDSRYARRPRMRASAAVSVKIGSVARKERLKTIPKHISIFCGSSAPPRQPVRGVCRLMRR